jgi:hypothetical protein
MLNAPMDMKCKLQIARVSRADAETIAALPFRRSKMCSVVAPRAMPKTHDAVTSGVFQLSVPGTMRAVMPT